MRLPIFRIFWGVALCVRAIFAYPPSCSEVFGRPTALHCAALLGASLGDEVHGQASSFYGIAGLDRPTAVSVSQYLNRVNIPKFWSSSEYLSFFSLFSIYPRDMSEQVNDEGQAG